MPTFISKAETGLFSEARRKVVANKGKVRQNLELINHRLSTFSQLFNFILLIGTLFTQLWDKNLISSNCQDLFIFILMLILSFQKVNAIVKDFTNVSN
jgi:hypothetical protein